MKFELLNKNVSSPELIALSIHNDYAVYKWFLFLLSAKSLRKRLFQINQNVTRPYRWLRSVTFMQIVLYLSFFCLALTIYPNNGYSVLVMACGVLVSVFCLYLVKKRCLVRLVKALIDIDYPEGVLQHKTLYQISEEYAKTYKIASLVDTIYASERQKSWVLKTVFFLTIFVFMLEVWVSILIAYACVILGYGFVNSLPLYRRLK